MKVGKLNEEIKLLSLKCFIENRLLHNFQKCHVLMINIYGKIQTFAIWRYICNIHVIKNKNVLVQVPSDEMLT